MSFKPGEPVVYKSVRNCADCKVPFKIRGARSVRCVECQPKHIRKTQREWRAEYKRQHPRLELLRLARQRARQHALPFALTEADVAIPAVCPVLGMPLASAAGKPGPGSPTVDRIEPAKGYVSGNVQVISHRANVLKHDASLVELVLLGTWAEYRLREQLAEEREGQ